MEFFDTLEGIDDYLKDELNLKIAKIRNHYQSLMEVNTVSVTRLRKQIELMNQLSPDAYSVANLSLIDIFKGVEKKE